MSHFYRRGGRGGYPGSAQASRSHNGGGGGNSNVPSKRVVYKVQKHAANQLNQYYLEGFTKLKKDSDLRQISNLSMTYKRIIAALAKYPMPILCADQTLLLEGVGNVLATRFNDMIENRKKEYEDGVFQLALLVQQNKQISKEARTFAGLVIPENEVEEIGMFSLTEYLVKRDQQIYRINNGLDEEPNNISSSGQPDKKRKFNEISNSHIGEDLNTKKKKLPGQSDSSAFLDTGSVSWSMLIAIYFLALHDDRKTYFITINSIKEMLDVLKNEFSDYMPFENDPKMLEQFAAGDLLKFRENQFIDIIESTIAKNPLEWKFTTTEKGRNRAKNLCKAVGLQIQLETDLENPNKNKITINMYDKDLMPVVDQLYMLDGTQVQQIKQESGGSVSRNQIFDSFVKQVEEDMDWILLSMGNNSENYNKTNFNSTKNQISSSANFKKEDQNNSSSNMLNQSLFGNLANLANKEEEDDDEENEDDDDIMMDDQPFDQNNADSILSKELMNMMVSDGSNQNSNQHLMQKGSLKMKRKYLGRQINRVPSLPVRLQNTGVICELKTLPLGDFIWVLRVRNPINPTMIDDEEFIEDEGDEANPFLTQAASKKQKKATSSTQVPRKTKKKQAMQKEYVDYVLDFICERKTADDLAASILDGRYDEQKFRLKNSEINNVIYLVEGKPSQYCKIPLQVLNKAQIHTQIFHGFNVLRIPTIQETLKWLTDMTREIKQRINGIKQTEKNFENKIKDTLIDFKHFQTESGKNSNLDVQHIFSRQLRTIKGLGTDHVSTISRVFKTPYLLYQSFKRCNQDEKRCLNLFNAGKMELMRNEYMYRQALTASDQVIITDEGNPTIPKRIDDSDQINLQNVINAADPKLYNKVLKQFEKDYGVRMRKINKNQSENIYQIFCSLSYKYRSNSKNGRNNNMYGYNTINYENDNQNDYEDME